MYFIDTPALNSMEAIMKRLPYNAQKGGTRHQSAYSYTKQDCDCRFFLHYGRRKDRDSIRCLRRQRHRENGENSVKSCPDAKVDTGKRPSSRESVASVKQWAESLHV